MADLDVRGLRFNVVQMGPGDEPPSDDPYAGYRLPVVFLHGLIMDNLSSFFYTIAPAVARTTDAVLYDLRGHGMSAMPASGYTPTDMAADLAMLMDHAGIACADLVGSVTRPVWIQTPVCVLRWKKYAAPVLEATPGAPTTACAPVAPMPTEAPK